MLLTRSFIHVPGIGERRELDLWRRGYQDWDMFLRHYPPGPWRDLIASRLDRSRAARDLPRREVWRLAAAFPGRTGYLDIETTGLSIEDGGITCIGLSDGRGVEIFVRGESLDRFPAALQRFELLVTYNGSSFDLPVLKVAFPDLDFSRFHHLDLRFPLHRLGIKGGLKGAERQLGLRRAPEVEGADGFLAVLLWKAHRAGHPTALETLVRYCLEDVVHLKPLLAHAHNQLAAALPIEVPQIEDTEVPAIPYRADGELVRQFRGQQPK